MTLAEILLDLVLDLLRFILWLVATWFVAGLIFSEFPL